MKFLTKQGLQHFLDKLKGIIPSKTSDLTNDSGFLTSHNPVDSALSSTSTNAVQNKVINNALTGKSDTGHTHSASDVSGLSTVATSGSYNDLTNKPAIPTVNNATLTIQKNGTTVKTFSANASSNVTANITVPTKTSDLTNDSGFLTTHNPIDSSLSSTSTNAVQNKVVNDALTGKSDTGHTHTVSNISDFPTLSTVATSGSYNDLSNKPTIPTVNNKTLTIQKNGTNVATFTANSSSNVTANITVPTNVSELTNDSGFLTASSNLDSSKLTGTIDIARLPKGALERLVTVSNQTARFALTTSDVQLGDTVKQLDTGVMYIVSDESKLSSNDGYTEYTAGSATSVPWSGVSGKPSSFTPSSHTHGSITNDGKLGTASRALVTDSSKNIAVSSVTSTELGYLSGVTSAIQTQLNGKSDSGHTHSASEVSGLSTVATSGSYNDLSNKPTIPTVNNATLTIQKNGSTVKTFTANASSNVTANITVPTKTSELTNDSHQTITTDTDTTSAESPAHSGTFTCIDSVTRDSNGHVTKVNTKTITLPSDNNTDTLVAQNYSTANNSYPVIFSNVAGVSSTSNRGNKGTIVNNAIYANPSTGSLYATKLYSGGNEVLTSHQSLSNYSTLANTVKSLSISGKTITVTPGSGSAYTLTTQDTVYTHPTTEGNKHIPSGGSSGQFLGWDSAGTAKWVNNPNTNTDTLMTQNVSTTNATYPILLCATANATANQGAKTGIFGSGVKVNPSTSTISATTFSGSLSGNAATSSGLITNTGIVQNGITYTGGSYYIGTSAGQLYKGSSNNPALISAPENGTYWAETSGNVQNLRFTWANDGKYLHDIFVSPNNNYIWHRDVVNGTARPWRRVVEENATGLTDQTWSINVGGNAATATQFSANKSVTLTGDVTGTASSKAGWSVATTLANSGVTAGTYGPSADVTGNNNATISVPQITVDAKGRVTSVVNKTLTCKNNTYTVNNATLTIQKNGTNVATFTSNASANTTANITVPTKVSELTNDLKYSCSLSGNAINFDWSTQYANKVGIKVDTTWLGGILTTANTTIPTKTSQLTNDSGFLTSHQSLANYVSLNGAQTISGQKIFTTMPAMRNTVFELGATPSSNQYAFIEYFDKNAVQTGWVGRVAYTNGYDSITISCANRFTNGTKATDGTRIDTVLEVALSPTGVRYLNTNAGWMSSVYPMTNEGANLGTTTARWNQIYAKGGSFSYGLDCGCIELNVSQGRSDGGLIDFHYNQSSADYTSRIIENGSGKLDINGVSFPIGAGKILAQTGSLVKGTKPSAQTWLGLYFNDKTYNESATHRIAAIEPYVGTNGTTGCYLRAYNWVANDQTVGSIAIHYPLNGTPYTEAPTPATSDNSTKIATTAYVKAQGYLTSHQSLANYVTLNGDQTITGGKTFSSTTVHQNEIIVFNPDITNYKATPSADTGKSVSFWSGDWHYWGGVGHSYSTSGDSAISFYLSNWSTAGDQGYASHTWKGTYSQEYHAYNPNAFMAKNGNYTFLIRNDGASTYFLMSAQGGNEGTWSNARPLTINNATGICDINGSCGGTSHGLQSSLTQYGDSVTYAEGQLTIGTASGNAYKGSSNNADLISFPENGTAWSTSANVQNLRLAWAGDWKYWHDIFVSPNNDYIWHRNVTGGTARGWRRVVEENVSGLTNQTWSINIGGTSANVTGTVAIANGGTGATSRLNAVKNLTNENVGTGTNYFLTITSNWGKAGYCSVADAKTVLSVPTKTSQLTNDSGFLTSHQSLSNYVNLNGTQTITGTKTFTGDLKFSTTATRGTAPSSTVNKRVAYYLDSAGNSIGLIGMYYNTDMSSEVKIFAYKTTAATGNSIGHIGIGCDASGNVFTEAPTPATTDNSTKIATTAFVNSFGNSKYVLNENFGKGTTIPLFIKANDFPNAPGTSSASIDYNSAVDGTKLYVWDATCNSSSIIGFHPTLTKVTTKTGQLWRYLGVTVYASGLGPAAADPIGILGLFRRES